MRLARGTSFRQKCSAVALRQCRPLMWTSTLQSDTELTQRGLVCSLVGWRSYPVTGFSTLQYKSCVITVAIVLLLRNCGPKGVVFMTIYIYTHTKIERQNTVKYTQAYFFKFVLSKNHWPCCRQKYIFL